MPSAIKNLTVDVIHLVWIPYGIELFQTFISSYKKFKSGYPHKLIFLFNGVTNREVTSVYHQYAQEQGLSYVSYYKQKGHDLDAYFWLAPQLTSDYILFLNSYSELLSDNWLLKYINIVTKESSVGAISATASFQSLYSSILLHNSLQWNKAASFWENYRKYKLILKTRFFYRFYFKPFPNPHIRTNAFLINREIFLSISFKTPKNKFGAYFFESGKNGLTYQLLRKNLAVFLVDRDGNFYKIPEWYQSQAFWTDDQKNLLVSDNQTRKFENANIAEKRKLTYMAWGVYE